MPPTSKAPARKVPAVVKPVVPEVVSLALVPPTDITPKHAGRVEMAKKPTGVVAKSAPKMVATVAVKPTRLKPSRVAMVGKPDRARLERPVESADPPADLPATNSAPEIAAVSTPMPVPRVEKPRDIEPVARVVTKDSDDTPPADTATGASERYMSLAHLTKNSGRKSLGELRGRAVAVADAQPSNAIVSMPSRL